MTRKNIIYVIYVVPKSKKYNFFLKISKGKYIKFRNYSFSFKNSSYNQKHRERYLKNNNNSQQNYNLI